MRCNIQMCTLDCYIHEVKVSGSGMVVRFQICFLPTVQNMSYRATAKNCIGCMFIRILMSYFANLVELRED